MGLYIKVKVCAGLVPAGLVPALVVVAAPPRGRASQSCVSVGSSVGQLRAGWRAGAWRGLRTGWCWDV